MNQATKKNILVIGGPSVGKTHFAGQFYGRVQQKKNAYRMFSPPDNLRLFEQVLDSLANGTLAGHTSREVHESISLDLENSLTKKRFTVNFPDYAGEQINSIFESRAINLKWQQAIQQSNVWYLFIRPEKLHVTEDIIKKQPSKAVLADRKKEKIPFEISAQAFFVELLQMFLFACRQNIPQLVVLLSCYDEVAQNNKGKGKKKPSELLREKLPLLAEFVENKWASENLAIIGLSSLGEPLDSKEPNENFQINGPEEMGYFVKPSGIIDHDLTKILNYPLPVETKK